MNTVMVLGAGGGPRQVSPGGCDHRSHSVRTRDLSCLVEAIRECTIDSYGLPYY